MKRQGMKLLMGAALAFLLVFGLVRLFQSRFQAGDVLPAYSSLRADPLGTRIFYESLSSCGFRVERNFRPLDRGRVPAGSTLLLLGENMACAPNDDLIPLRHAMELNLFMRHGGRVVLTLLPMNVQDRQTNDSCRAYCRIKPAAAQGTNTPVSATNHPSCHFDIRESGGAFMRTTNWLGASFTLVARNKSSPALPASPSIPPDLPRTLNCHTDLCFSNAAAGWSVLYQRAGHPVVMEKKVGAGSLVISTPSFFLSNEAMWNERLPALLLWLIGGKKRVVFDETHLGLTRSQDVFSLIHQYRLGRTILLLFLYAVLFIWRNSSSLVPPEAGRVKDEGESASGKDSMAGLINLLRRNVPRRDLLAACVAAWKKTVERGSGAGKDGIRNVETLLKAASDNQETPVRLYNRIVNMIKVNDSV